MKNRIGVFIVIFLTAVAFISCDELGGADKPSNKTLAFFAFNSNTLDTMGRYNGTEPASPDYVSGQGTETVPEAIDLDRVSSQFVDVPGLTQSFAADFSVAAWINIDAPFAAGTIYPIVSKGSGGAGTAEFAFYVDSGGNLTLLLGDGGTGYTFSTGGISAGTWYYVAATVENNNVALYINPTESSYAAAATDTAFTGTRASGSDSLQIGRYHNGITEYFFDGSVDQVRIANYAFDGYGLGVIHDEE